MSSKRLAGSTILLGAVLCALVAPLTAQPEKKASHEQEWNRVVDKAIAYC